ncbi:MAG: YraN family protein [Patescibacteria group bacterium]|nr:YraN family protein [Patescibacteria group bacterium]
MNTKKSLGNLGEDLARKFLEERGYKILSGNYHSRHGEADLVVYDQKTKDVVFVEVKTRSGIFYGSPSEAVDRRKKARLTYTAQKYLKENNYGLNQNYRFDIISVELDVKNRSAKIKQEKYI